MRPRTMPGRLLLAAVACAAVLLPGLAAGPASAATRAPNGEFVAVSCPTATWCMAVGQYVRSDRTARALRGKDGHFTRQRTPNPPAG